VVELHPRVAPFSGLRSLLRLLPGRFEIG